MGNKIVKKGDKVRVHYTGSLTDGKVFDSSVEREPLEVRVGDGLLITGFENALLGMQVGEKKKVLLAPQDAYGDYHPDLVREIDKKFLPPELKPMVGMQLQIGEHEDMTIVTITAVTDKQVRLDANHPLAGQTLNFEIEVVEIGA